MVYYFTSSVVDPAGFIYVGKDKFESKPHILLYKPSPKLTDSQTRISLNSAGRKMSGKKK